MRLKFFPGTELSPPFLLGGIMDLDRPQHVLANVLLNEQGCVEIQPIVPLVQDQLDALMSFGQEIVPAEVERIEIGEITQYNTRRRAMC